MKRKRSEGIMDDPGEHEPNNKGGDSDGKERRVRVMDVRNADDSGCNGHELARESGTRASCR